MAGFSSSEINDAKRRVREMRERARSFVDENPQAQSVAEEIMEDEQKDPHSKENSTGEGRTNESNIFNDLFSRFGLNNTDFSDGSSALVLALILILSREKADNMLILALLYILL